MIRLGSLDVTVDITSKLKKAANQIDNYPDPTNILFSSFLLQIPNPFQPVKMITLTPITSWVIKTARNGFALRDPLNIPFKIFGEWSTNKMWK